MKYIEQLNEYTCLLYKDDDLITSKETGIKPLMILCNNKVDLKGYCLVDKIVGKAVAMLVLYAGIKKVYAKVMSIEAKRLLEENNIHCEYEALTDKIINRNGTDICPMEKAIMNVEDCDVAYQILKEKTAFSNK